MVFPEHPPSLLAYDLLLGRYTCHNHNPPHSNGAVYKMKGKMKQITSAELIRSGTSHTHTCSLGEADSVTSTSPGAELPLCPHSPCARLTAQTCQHLQPKGNSEIKK